MALTVTKEEIDRLRRRYKELGEVIDELTDTLARSSSATEQVLEPELIRARKELVVCGRAPQEPERREFIVGAASCHWRQNQDYNWDRQG